MGYILPVQNFQYFDYHQRITEEKKNQYFINKPFKAVLEDQYQEVKDHPVSNHTMLTKEHTEILSRNPKALRTKADLTGKGHLFNQYI